MHTLIRDVVAFSLLSSAMALGAEPLTLTQPQSCQVLQRIGVGPGKGYADVQISGLLPAAAHEATWEYHIVGLADQPQQPGKTDAASEWTSVIPTITGDTFQATVPVPAGGWYRLECRCRVDDNVLATGAVEPIGVGEVFVVAGQSYATNCNDERLTVADPQQRVVAFDSAKQSWAVANDPQPVFDGSDGGSIWPPLGDALAKEFGVPIGFANVAIGGSSSAQWLPDGDMLPRLINAGKTLGAFRAVLWQQGESDVITKNPTEGYVANIKTIRETAAKAWGDSPPWLLAKSTQHPTVYNDPEGEGRIRAGIDELTKQPGFLPGPDTDTLTGENRGDINSRRHFTGIGQRRAADMWLTSIRQELLTTKDEGDGLRVGMAASNIVIAATHSHTAPDYMTELWLYLGKEKQEPQRVEYIEKLINGPVDAIVRAHEDAGNFTLSTGVGTVERGRDNLRP